MSGYIEIDDMPVLGAVTDTTQFVGEKAGSGLFSATALRSYINPWPPYTSVKAFGAVGDGVADDTAALRSAFNCGTPVWLPAGTYRVTSPIETADRQIIIAENVNAYEDPSTASGSIPVTQIVADNAGGGYASGNAVLRLNDWASIAGFGIQSVPNVDAVYAPGRFIRMDHIYTRYGRHGANLNAVGPQLYACRFQSASGYGIWGQSFCTDGVFVGVYVVASGTGAYFQDAIKLLLIGCTAEWNTGHGFSFFQGASCSLTGCAMDRNGGAGLFLSACTNMSVAGNVFHRNGASGAAPQAHVSFAGVLSALAFSGNTYRVFNSMDDLSGTLIPAYSMYVAAGTTMQRSVFGEAPTPGTVAFFDSTASEAIVRPYFLMAAGGTPGRYANDAASAAAGVQVGSPYIDTAGIFRQRVA